MRSVRQSGHQAGNLCHLVASDITVLPPAQESALILLGEGFDYLSIPLIIPGPSLDQNSMGCWGWRVVNHCRVISAIAGLLMGLAAHLRAKTRCRCAGLFGLEPKNQKTKHKPKTIKIKSKSWLDRHPGRLCHSKDLKKFSTKPLNTNS